jgi:mitotic spindle assembly checkpoint protein MAD1
LSLKDNPAQVWADTRQAVLDRLREENEALLKRLSEVQDRGGGSEAVGHGGMVPKESWELVNKEKKELEETVKQKEKRLLRLQQVWVSPLTT